MKRMFGIAVLGSTAALGLTVGAGADGRHDRVTGVAENTFPGGGPNRLAVDAARSRADGDRPRGEVRARGDLDGVGPMEPFRFKGRVTCLRVVGKHAAIKYRFEEAQGGGAPLKGGGVQVFIEDNGKPRSGTPVDANAFDAPQSAASFKPTEKQCDDPSVRPDYDPVDSGDYAVRDRDAKQAADPAGRRSPPLAAG